MPCSAPLSPEARAGAPDCPEAAARSLTGVEEVRLQRLPGGGNNRLYRVEADGEAFALKCYGATDRLTREFEGLSFLAAAGVETVPCPQVADPALSAALYEWIVGEPVARGAGERPEGDMGQALALAARLAGLKDATGAGRLGEAAEACLSLAELLRQIEARFARLAEEAADLTPFLGREVRPAIDHATERARTLYGAAGLDPVRPLDAALRTLSPSDFGFHNALRRPDGRLAFLDFEYFGWDDPVKLTADLLWHPAFALSAAERDGWAAGCAALFGNDPGFAVRLRAQMPLYGLRWCLILLNEFLPDRWERRRFAGTAAGWEEAKAIQHAKAVRWLDAVSRLLSAPDGTVLPLILPAPPPAARR